MYVIGESTSIIILIISSICCIYDGSIKSSKIVDVIPPILKARSKKEAINKKN
jgi:hypothetical protein